jgi:RNA polymerase sigma-70 factor (ECF subfamily)
LSRADAAGPDDATEAGPDDADGVDAAAVVERVWRTGAAGMLGALSRRLGDFDLATDALADALVEALKRWPDDGVPGNPQGWLVTTGWRRAVDRLRRDAVGREKVVRLAAEPAPLPGADDRLAMIFSCCHPALPEQSRVALTLYAASGLTTEEIAAAFLVPVATMAQRLVRAKRQLRDRAVRFEPPDPHEYPRRLPAVLAVIYLVFNEGYLASGRAAAQRRDLAREGLELARQVAALLPREPEAAGLAALLELHEARAATRFDSWGRIVLLEQQDRTRWDRAAIRSAAERLGAAVARGRPGPYQVQAGIAAQHALAHSYETTDWAAVRGLYDRLFELDPSPVVLLGRAVATRYVCGPAAALDEVDALGDRLDGYRLWHATRAELLAALDRPAEAGRAARRAHALATNPAERELMARRIAAVSGP